MSIDSYYFFKKRNRNPIFTIRSLDGKQLQVTRDGTFLHIKGSYKKEMKLVTNFEDT